MAPSKKSAIAAAQREFVLDSLNNTIPLTIEEIREKHPLLSDSEVRASITLCCCRRASFRVDPPSGLFGLFRRPLTS